jgi:hypothetical protein
MRRPDTASPADEPCSSGRRVTGSKRGRLLVRRSKQLRLERGTLGGRPGKLPVLATGHLDVVLDEGGEKHKLPTEDGLHKFRRRRCCTVQLARAAAQRMAQCPRRSTRRGDVGTSPAPKCSHAAAHPPQRSNAVAPAAAVLTLDAWIRLICRFTVGKSASPELCEVAERQAGGRGSLSRSTPR